MNAAPEQQALKQVATNLFRSDITGVYYAIFKRDRRQVKRSLHTTNRQLAWCRMVELRHKIDRLFSKDPRTLPFAEYDDTGKLIGGLAKRWFDITAATIEPSTRDRYLGNIKQLSVHFHGKAIGSIGLKDAEAWAIARAKERSKETFTKERDVLVRIIQYGVDHKLLLDNFADKINRPTPDKKPIQIPTRAQFRQLVATMRANRGDRSADLTEVLARSGCRLSEIVGNKKYDKEPMRWRDIDFERKLFTVTKSKNHEPRFVPLFPLLEVFLQELLNKLPTPPRPDDRIIAIRSAKKSIGSACRALHLPQYGHHTCRHLFCSNCLEAGVDFKTISEWVGHSDGGILVAGTYGHLRNEHSAAMARLIIPDPTEIEQPTNIVPIEAAYRSYRL